MHANETYNDLVHGGGRSSNDDYSVVLLTIFRRFGFPTTTKAFICICFRIRRQCALELLRRFIEVVSRFHYTAVFLFNGLERSSFVSVYYHYVLRRRRR